MEGNVKRRAFRLRAAGVAAAAAVAAGVLATAAFAVVGGSPDNGRHPYVGMVAFLYGAPDKPQAELCSGSLLSPTVFVTAAHCVPPADLQLATLVTFVEHGAVEALHGGPFVVADSVTVDPKACQQCGHGLVGFDTHDVAVVRLPADAASTYPGFPTTYAQLPSLGQDDHLAKKTQVDIVGYGLTALGERQVAAANVIPGGGAIGDEFLKLSSNLAQGKGATCSGDSGGPDLLAGTNTILSISGFGPNASCKAVAYSQRLDTADELAFVNGFLQ
jgi:secreted trypsin-like serine protease